MGWLDKLFARDDGYALPLYNAVVAAARAPHWYVEGAVPDTVEGRFEMVASVLAILLVRLEAEGEAAALANARLAERFIADMDGQLRQLGIGDVSVGKNVGNMISLVGGRVSAFREGLAAGDLGPALARNLYRGADVPADALAHSASALAALHAGLVAVPLDALLAGGWPA